jgi:predicted nucleic acid-binding protein
VTSPNLRSVAADSNVLLAAIAGRAALRVFDRPKLQIVTTDANVVEVRENIPEFAARYGLAEEELFEALAVLPVEIYSKGQYATHVFEARSLLAERDPDDVPLAALALKLGIPVWSNDRDFDAFPTGVYSTAKLIKVLGV